MENEKHGFPDGNDHLGQKHGNMDITRFFAGAKELGVNRNPQFSIFHFPHLLIPNIICSTEE